MRPGRYNIAVTVGDSLYRSLTWKTGPANALQLVNLTGATAKMRVQTTAGVALFTISTTASATGSITLGGAAGTIQIHVTPAGNTIAVGKHDYDLEITLASGDVHTLLSGTYEGLKQVSI
jgi:hypothetical protein